PPEKPFSPIYARPVTADARSARDKRLTNPKKWTLGTVASARRWDYIVSMVFQPIDPAPPPFRRRFKAIPVRTLLPNLITLLALCAGLTAIRVAVENRL